MVYKNKEETTEYSNSTKININESNIKIVNYIPHKRWRWVVLFSSIIIKIITSGTFSTFRFFMKDFIKEFQTSESTMSWMLSLNSCISVVVAPLAIYLALKFGHRIIIISGLTIAGISFAVPYFYSRFWFVFISGSVINAIGQGFVNTCSTVLLTTYFDNHLPIVLGIHACSSGLAPCIVAPLIRFLLLSYGWRFTRLIYGSIYLAGALLALTFKPVKHNSWDDNFHKFHLGIDKLKPEVQLTEIVKKTEGELNNYFGSQTDRICTFISTANIASTIARKSELSNCYSSNFSVHFTKSLMDPMHASKDLVNINVNTLLGMSVASNLHMKPFLHQLSMLDVRTVPPEKTIQNQNEYQENIYKSLLKNPVFLLFLFVNLFTNLGYDTNFIYSKSKALEDGMSDFNGLFLPMCMGIGTIIGRLLFGYLGSQESTNIYNLFTSCLILSGCSSLFSLIALSFPLMLTYAMLFGTFIGGFLSLNTSILSSIVTIFNFDRCLRVIYVSQAIGLLFGAPISGYIHDATKSFRWCLLTSGIMIFLSGIILPFAYLSKLFQRNQNNENGIEEI